MLSPDVFFEVYRFINIFRLKNSNIVKNEIPNRFYCNDSNKFMRVKNIHLCKLGSEKNLVLDLKSFNKDRLISVRLGSKKIRSRKSKCSPHKNWVESVSNGDLAFDSVWSLQILPNIKIVSNTNINGLSSSAAHRIFLELKKMKAPAFHIHSIDDRSGVKHQGRIKHATKLICSELKKIAFKNPKNMPPFIGNPWGREGNILVQLFMKDENQLAISLAELSRNHNIFWNKPLPVGSGYVNFSADQKYPAESNAKLKEIFFHMSIKPDGLKGKICVELGSAPGGWSMVILEHGAILNSIDWANLNEPWLINHANLTHRTEDAREFNPVESNIIPPGGSVDYLFCDMALPPIRSLDTLEKWIKNFWARTIVWTFKLGFHNDDDYIELIRQIKSTIDKYGKNFVYTLRHLYRHENEIVMIASWI